MPELPEVEVSSQVAARALRERVVTAVNLKPCKLFRIPKRAEASEGEQRVQLISDPDQLTSLLRGAKGVLPLTARHGKLMACLIETIEGRPLCLFARLGMTGKFILNPSHLPLRSGVKMSLLLAEKGTAEPTTRLDFINTRMFGAIWGAYVDHRYESQELERVLMRLFSREVEASAMGPDVYELCQTPQRWIDHLRSVSQKRQVKTALLDQKLLAGVGNIYAVEGLFVAKAHPLSRVQDLSDQQLTDMAEGIRVAMRATLERSAGRDEVVYGSAQGEESPFAVYGRDGLPCRVCHQDLVLMRVGGRATVFCPHCQSHKSHL